MGDGTTDMARAGVARTAAEVLAWIGVGGVGLLMVTQAVGWDGHGWLAVAQALTPYAIAALVPLCAIGLWWLRSPALGAIGAVIGLSGMVLSLPVVLPPDLADPAPGATGMRVASVNLLFDNTTVDEVADDLADRRLDVIVFIEYTVEHEEVLGEHPLAQQFPYTIDQNGPKARGMAVWSRYPMVDPARRNATTFGINVNIDGPDGEMRILGVHPPTPVWDYTTWSEGLDLIGERATRNGPPTLIVGDFNATYWNPAFRDLLDVGFVDAHMAIGDPFARSWPTDESVPPFVQIDHALIGPGLTATSIEDFHVPGSDHRGFVVTVAPTR